MLVLVWRRRGLLERWGASEVGAVFKTLLEIPLVSDFECVIVFKQF